MFPGRLAVAVAAAVGVVLSAPFAQQAFTEAASRWPDRLRVLGISATVLPVGATLVFGLARIRERRRFRYLALALGVSIGAAYILLTDLTFSESFHFAEYGLLTLLFYRVWHARGDGSVLLLPALAGLLTGTLDEWFQWFVPIRAGEARDVALNAIAIGCGLLVAVGIEPPRPLTLALRRESLLPASAWAAAGIVVFGLFFQSAHLGHDVTDEEIGMFRSRYTAAGLLAAARERADRWRDAPPLVQRRVAREDQYLTEGLWHVQQRNQAWSAGETHAAWRENRILEKFYAPVLDAPSHAGVSGHRWPPEQRAEAARSAADRRPYVSNASPVPMYAWPRPLFWAVYFAAVAVIAAVCLRFSLRP